MTTAKTQPVAPLRAYNRAPDLLPEDTDQARQAVEKYEQARADFGEAGEKLRKANAGLAAAVDCYAHGERARSSVSSVRTNHGRAVDCQEVAELALLDALLALGDALEASRRHVRQIGSKRLAEATAKRDAAMQAAGLTGRALAIASKARTEHMQAAEKLTRVTWAWPVAVPSADREVRPRGWSAEDYRAIIDNRREEILATRRNRMLRG